MKRNDIFKASIIFTENMLNYGLNTNNLNDVNKKYQTTFSITFDKSFLIR